MPRLDFTWRHAVPLVLLTLTVALTGCAGGGSGAGANALERVRSSGKLKVAIDPTYPPMESISPDGELIGFDVDVAKELARRLGVEASFQVMDWSGIIAGLTSGRYDVIISSMNITDERKQQVAFVEYAQMAQVFVCKAGTPVHAEADLAGKIVCVQINTTSHTWVEELAKKSIKVGELKAFQNATDTFNALKAGQAEVIVTDEPVGRFYAKQDGFFEMTGEAMKPEPVGIALRQEDRDLQEALAAAVAAMKQDGTYEKISRDWFGGELGQSTARQLDFWSFSFQVVIPRLWAGMWLTIELTLASGLIGILLGLFLALGGISRSQLLRKLVLLYVTLFRGTPLLLQVLFVYFALPQLLSIRLDALPAGILALSLNAAAYVSEIMRAAIQSIDKGQMEAARALGMSYRLAMRRIVLPQTYRRLIPPLVNELAALSKDTSLVMVIALPELLFQTQRLAAAYLRPWEVYAWAALGYLLIVLLLTAAAGYLEKRLTQRET